MKKIIACFLAALFILSFMGGCSPKGNGGDSSKVLKVAALESAYGTEAWKEIAKKFEEANSGVKVELTIDKNLEDVISPQMKAGNYPDVVYLSTSRPSGLTETLIRENALRDLDAVMDMTVPGEDVKVKDKIMPGFLDTLVTKPYNDGKTYLVPVFYGPSGLFYNAGLFKQKGWTVPTTWDEMWELGEKAKAEGIALFTYPTANYFDSFFFALLQETGGADFYNRVMKYDEGVWDTPEAGQALEIVAKLATYTEKSTVANANNSNYLKNQQLILDNKALFMPNGTWVVGEMKDAPKAEGFEWGFMALPAVTEGGDRYAYTLLEQVWSPKESKNQELADKFIAYLYSDEAVQLFIEKSSSPAVQPVKNVSEKLPEEDRAFYGIYDNGAKVALGNFAATDPVEGVSMGDTLFGTINSLVNGDKTVEQWKADVSAASDKLRAALK